MRIKVDNSDQGDPKNIRDKESKQLQDWGQRQLKEYIVKKKRKEIFRDVEKDKNRMEAVIL